MLFDLEEYVNLGIIGPNSKHPKLINWSEAYNTSRYTRDAYLKAVNEHFLATQVMTSPAEFQALKVKHVAFLDAFVDFGPKYNAFWNAMVSFPLSETEGLTDGVKFDVYEVAKNEQNPNYIEYPATSPTNTWWMDNYRTIAIINPDGPYTFTTLTGEIIAEHKYSFASFMATVKDILVTAEGKPENLTDWVTPEVMPFETYPEVTGYVRGTNSLPIKDAIVRLVDADGVSHEVITDDKGYYKFSNEYVYNNVALTAAGATNSFIDGSFNMFLLDHKNGSTASLYNKTSKFENSFFGAENNRSMTWPVYVKMGRNNRRNFKIEFIPNYSNFPSFSGYVKDAAGNPIKDALVFIKDSNSGYGIGQYRKPNGDDAINYKYNDFGVDRTILTDENGFYEYTSQMVGEWFNKHGFVEYGIPTTILTNPARVNESMNRWMMSNEFVVYLMPYKQDPNSTSMNWGDGTAIYDSNDYVASRFEYALSNVTNQFYWRDIVMGQNNVFNVDVVPAVGNEVMADKIKMTCTPGSRNISGYIESTSGYYKFVFSNGVSEVKSGWFDFSHSNYGYDTTMFSEEFYVYSCDSEGRASGYITKVDLSDTEFSNISNIDFSETENLAKLDIPGLYASDIDLSGLSKLYKLRLSDSKYLETISGLEDSKYLSEVLITNNQRLTSLPFVNKDWIYLYEFTNLPMVSSLDLSTNGKKSCINGNIQIGINGLESLESINLGFVGHTGDYGFSTQLYGCKQLLVDDVDSLLQQFVDSGKRVDLYTDKARSSDSDAAYDTLINRNSNLNFGSEYFESNEVKKSVVMYVDPSFGPDSNNSQKTISLNGYVSTTTGYFRLNAWFDNGYPLNQNIYQGQFNREINVEFDDTFESRPIEIYSTDEYGRPSGSITGIDFNNNNNEDFKNIVDIDLTQATELTSLIIKKSGLTSLDLTLNVMLDNLSIIESGKIETIYVGGLVSLNLLNLDTMGSITTIDGVETLTGLDYIDISDCPELDFVSLSTFTSLREINISNVFKYDSTHVDTMLSELKLISDDRASTLNILIVNKQAEHDVKLAELSAFDAQEPTISTLAGQLDTLYTELNQLISDGADQSLIDSKQVEVNTKSAELSAKEVDRKLISNQVDTLDSEISDLNSQISNSFSGYIFGTGYMARTSASDADYDSLLTYGWNLYIGSEFVAPYTLPVKGYITLDWEGNDQRYMYFTNLITSTGYYTFKDGSGNIYSNSGNSFQFYAYKGVLEFWSTDQFGRAGGDLTHLEFGNEFVTSVDFDNLTSLTNLSVRYTQITTIDVSNLTNLIWFDCNYNSKITSITGLNLLTNLERFVLLECTKLTNVDTSGFESLTTLGLDGNSSLTDIDISTFSSLTSLDIRNQNFDTAKHLDVHVNINNIYYDFFRTFTSADLDTLLAELDANGQSNGQLYVGYVARTEASDVAFNNLLNKGWSLGIGSYFIGPNEAPAKGYIHFEDTTINESISFHLNSETNYFVIKYPNGTTETRNSGVVYYDFDSSIPVEERIIEVYGADQFGRPTDSIIGITDLNECSSVEFSALKKLRFLGLDQNNRITTLNLDDVVSLESVFTNNCPLLETISIVGCTASKRDLYMNSCPLLDIDAFLIQLDETGSLPHEYGAILYANEDHGIGFTPARTHASDAAVESLLNKGFELRVVEPAGDTLTFRVDNSWNNKDLRIGTNTGYFKIVFPVGSQLRDQYPNGVIHNIQNARKFNSGVLNEVSNDIGYAPIDAGRLNDYSTNVRFWEYDMPTAMNIEIYSCSEYGVPSGDITLLFIGGGLTPLTTMSKVIALELNPSYGVSWNGTTYTNYSNAYSNISFTGMTSLKYFGLFRGEQPLNWIGANYPSTFNVNLTGSDVKHLFLYSEFNSSKNINLLGVTKSSLVSLNYNGFNMGNLDSSYSSLTYLRATQTRLGLCNLASTPLKKINIHQLGESGNNGNLSSLQLPSTLVDAYFGLEYSGLRGDLDLSGLTNLVKLNIYGYNEQSDDNGSSANVLGFSSLQSLDEIRLHNVSTSNLNLSGLPITWIEFNYVNQYRSSFTTGFSNLSPNLRYISLQNMPTLSGDLSFDIRITDPYPSGFNMEYCNQVTSLTFTRVLAGAWISRNDLLSTITFGTEGGNFVGYDYNISNNKILSSVVNARTTNLQLRENLSSAWNGNGWSYVCLLDGAPFDAIMQTLSDTGRYSGYFYSSGVKRTHNSDSAKSTLLSRSWSVYRDGGSEFV